MKTLNTIQDLRSVVYQLQELRRKARALRNLYTWACNGDLSKRQVNRQTVLETQAYVLAKQMGLTAYFQRDPRGCSLYLIDDGMDNSNYTEGIAIY